jgi:hypothetical protein
MLKGHVNPTEDSIREKSLATFDVPTA